MNNNSELNTGINNEGSHEKAVPVSEKRELKSIFQELEFMALQKGNRGSLDLNQLDKDQRDLLLNTMAENEKNAFYYHSKRLDAFKEIEIARINASVINKKTLRFLVIGLVVLVIPVLTLVILILKDTYFIPWLTFLTGILGGFGASKVTSKLFADSEVKNPIDDSLGEK